MCIYIYIYMHIHTHRYKKRKTLGDRKVRACFCRLDWAMSSARFSCERAAERASKRAETSSLEIG